MRPLSIKAAVTVALFAYNFTSLAQDVPRAIPVEPSASALDSTPEITGPSRAMNASYKLAPRDIIVIKVFREPDLTTEARIDKNGTITFPLIGSVRVLGLTPQQAAQKIKAELGADYLVDPQVSVEVAEYSKRRFTILGQVANPGTFEMPEDTTTNLLEAIGMAGGYTKISNQSRITLKRIENGKEVLYRLDGKKMAKDPKTEIFEIRPGDTITVGETIF